MEKPVKNPIKPARLRKTADDGRAMATYVSLFLSMEDAAIFEKAVLSMSKELLPPCARVVKEGGPPTATYWRWLAITAEVWS